VPKAKPGQPGQGPVLDVPVVADRVEHFLAGVARLDRRDQARVGGHHLHVGEVPVPGHRRQRVPQHRLERVEHLG
jgi:hypothetical protein